MRNDLAVCGLLLLGVGLVFGQTVRYDFIALDDTAFICLNPHVTGGLTPEAVKWAFTHCHAGAYTPVTWITHMLDCQFYGLDAGGHHLTNVLLHAATAVLLFLVLRRMAGRPWPSAFAAAVFAFHPLRVESVAWVVERKDLLSGLFFVLALGAYVGYARHRFSFVRYSAVIVLFALGLMAKPMLVTFPFVLLLLDYWPLGRISATATGIGGPERGGNPTASAEPMMQPRFLQETRLPFRASLWTVARCSLEKVPLFALTGVFCAMAMWSFGAYKVGMFDERFPLSWRIGGAPIAYVRYLEMFVWPVGLALPYPRPGMDLSLWKVFGAVAVLVVLTVAALAARRRCPYLLVGWLWYMGMLVPVSGIVPMGTETMADRFTYLPQIGLCIALAWGLADLSRHWPYRRAVCAVGATLVLVLLMGRAWHQTSLWRSNETLWTHALACTSPNSGAHHALGNTFLGLGQIDKAVEQFEAAIAIEPGYAMAHYNLGVALASLGRLDEAMEQYRKTVQLQPNNPAAHNNLGNALLIRGQIETGMLHCQEALRIDPEFAEAHFNVGNIFLYRGRVDDAIAEYRKALEAKPEFPEAHVYLGIALAKCGQLDDAIAEYREALRIDPEYEDARRNLDLALKLQKKAGNAIEEKPRGR
jgi:protein O-mannosyl-transferase